MFSFFQVLGYERWHPLLRHAVALGGYLVVALAAIAGAVFLAYLHLGLVELSWKSVKVLLGLLLLGYAGYPVRQCWLPLSWRIHAALVSLFLL